MRPGVLVLLFSCLAIGVGLGIATGQEEESKTSAKPPSPTGTPLHPDQIWNFHFEGKKGSGEFLELLKPDEGKQRHLMITHLELRTRQSTRVQVVQHKKERRQGKEGWIKSVRRSELFSLGWQDSTTQYVVSGFDSVIGMKFGPGTRPGIEVTNGGGEMAVYAEGYWSRP